MKPFTRLTFVVLTLIAILHLVRLVIGVQVQVGTTQIPTWPSALGILVFGGLAFGLWREHRGP